MVSTRRPTLIRGPASPTRRATGSTRGAFDNAFGLRAGTGNREAFAATETRGNEQRRGVFVGC